MKTDAKNQCRITGRLDGIPMMPAEREAAKAYLRQGALIASLIVSVLAWSRAIAEHVGRGVRGLARHTH